MPNIDSVYKTVLFILNKEQRGYIPPAEFNSLGTQVQEEIFQSYFPDGNQLNRQNQNNTQNDTDFFNMYKNNSYKLFPFQGDQPFAYNTTNDGWKFNNVGAGTLYNIGEIIFFNFLSLSYLSFRSNLIGKIGYLDLPAAIMEVNGDSKIIPAKFLFCAISVATPVPRDSP